MNRLQWVRQNQATLRVERYRGLQDQLASDAAQEGARVGNVFISPPLQLHGEPALHAAELPRCNGLC